MDNIVYYNDLYDLYGCLLTEKQRKYFEDYYFNNLSLAEMAENYEVSRNAIFNQLHVVTEKLVNYEDRMKLFEKREKLLSLTEKITDSNLREKLEELI